MSKWLYFKSDYAVGAIEVKDNIVVTTPPIWKGYIGLTFEQFKRKFLGGCGWSTLAKETSKCVK